MRAFAIGSAAVGVVVILSGQASPGPSVAHDADVALATSASPLLAIRAAVSRDLDAAEPSDEELTAVVQRTCVVCHNDQLMTGNLSLELFEVGDAGAAAEAAEMVIEKLRAEMMPPPGIPRPGGDTLQLLAEALENELDEYWDSRPNPGVRPFQRLNRPEYERAIRDILGLRIDAGRLASTGPISGQLRQHGLCPGHVGHAAHGLSECRRRHQPSCRGVPGRSTDRT